jgi:hypothetical protein
MLNKRIISLCLASALCLQGCASTVVGSMYLAEKIERKNVEKLGAANRANYERITAEFKAQGDPWGDYMEAEDYNYMAGTTYGEKGDVYKTKYMENYKKMADKGMREGKIILAKINLINPQTREINQDNLNILIEEFNKNPFYLKPAVHHSCYKQYSVGIGLSIAVAYQATRTKENPTKNNDKVNYWRAKDDESYANPNYRPQVAGLCKSLPF